MKKLLITLGFIGMIFIDMTYATDYSTIKDFIKKKCSSFQSTDYFSTGQGCSGIENSIYYVKNLKVTKDVFDAQKKEYSANWPICEETKESKPWELPWELIANCVEWKYWSYFNKWVKISYTEFQKIVFGAVLKTAMEQSIKQQNDYINKKKKILKSKRSFIKDLKSKDPVFFSYSIVGSKCIWNGSITYNGNGYKDMVCTNNIVQSVKYLLNNKEISFSIYVDSIYNTEKTALK